MEEILRDFYLKTNKEEREAVLERWEGADPARRGTVEFLWKQRYQQKRRFLPPLKDAFLNAYMDMLYLFSQGQNGASRKRMEKELLRTAERLGLSSYEQESEEGKELYRMEYQNTAMFFIELGMDDQAYSRGVLHMTKLNEAKLAAKYQRDLSIIAYRLPGELGLTELFRPVAEGICGAYTTVFPERKDAFLAEGREKKDGIRQNKISSKE